MTKQEQIKEMVKDYKCCIACEMYNKYASHPCIDDNLPENCSICREQAEELIKEGYRKTIWHKVADGDLPKKDGFYLVYGRTNLGIINKIVERYWIMEYSNGVLGDGLISHNEYEEGNIAWTELPEYVVGGRKE